MPPTRYVLALDQGTTSSRALLFDSAGAFRAQAQAPFAQSFPEPGWVEHDPEAIWASQLATAAQALQGVEPAAVASIGIANQRETVLLWERASGRPLAPAIVWQDRRTAAFCQALRARGVEGWVRERSGLPLDPYFSASKIAWWLQAEPTWRRRAEAGELAVGTVDSWLLWRLTQGRVHATDVSNASRTQLMNLHTGQWDAELLRLFDIPAALLPEIRPSSAAFGHTTLLGGRIAIGALAGDQQAALFGQGCTQAGQVKNTYGTGCFMLMHTGGQAVASQHGLLTTRAAQGGGVAQFALEGSVFVGGAVVQWLRDGLGLIQHSGDVEALAASVPDSAGVSLVPAFTGLGAPYWDPDARGALLGLTRGSTQAHIARAALDAIALQSTELLAAMQADAPQLALQALRVDGGACANNLLMQTQADVLGLAVERPALLEATAWGAAQLAALQAGFDLQPAPAAMQRFVPQRDGAWRAAKLKHWRAAVARVRGA